MNRDHDTSPVDTSTSSSTESDDSDSDTPDSASTDSDTDTPTAETEGTDSESSSASDSNMNRDTDSDTSDTETDTGSTPDSETEWTTDSNTETVTAPDSDTVTDSVSDGNGDTGIDTATSTDSDSESETAPVPDTETETETESETTCVPTDTFCCQNTDCSGHATCSGDGECICDNGYSGDACDYYFTALGYGRVTHTEGQATAVSEDGLVVVGWSRPAIGSREPFRWKNGSNEALGTLEDGYDAILTLGTYSHATAVDNSGDIIVGDGERAASSGEMAHRPPFNTILRPLNQPTSARMASLQLEYGTACPRSPISIQPPILLPGCP